MKKKKSSRHHNIDAEGMTEEHHHEARDPDDTTEYPSDRSLSCSGDCGSRKAESERHPSTPPPGLRRSTVSASSRSGGTAPTIPGTEEAASGQEWSEKLHFRLLQSPSYESLPGAALGEDDFDFDLPLRWYKRAWSIVLGFAGVLDILAYLEPTLRNIHHDKCPVSSSPSLELGELLLEAVDLDAAAAVAAPVPWYCSTWMTFLTRLREYNVVIAFVFSLLWFNNSLNKAREEYYHKFTVQEDRVKLLTDDAETFNAEHRYYRRLFSRMLLLPVGFFVIVFYLLRGLMRGEWLYRELLIKPANETVFLTVQDPNEYVTIEISEAHAKMSTAFAIFTYLKNHFRLAATLFHTKFRHSAMAKVKRQLFVKARSPRKLIRQLKLVLKYMRWTKYILPLVLKVTKLRANCMLTLRKRRLYNQTKKRWKLQRQSITALSSPSPKFETEEHAAVLIQRVWRSHQRHLYQRVALHFVTDKKLSAAMKIQVAYRRMSLRVRAKVSRKKRELLRLEKLKRQASKELDADDRRRLYELQDEFMAEAKKTINQRMLMRPNTRRAVLWNSIFVFCIFVEISHHAFKPWLTISKAKRTDPQEYNSLRWLLAESLIPEPVAETLACKDIFKRPSAFRRLFYRRHHVEQPTRQEVVRAFVDEITNFDDYGPNGIGNDHDSDTNYASQVSAVPWRCSEPISTWRDGYRDIVSLAFRPNPVWEWPACQEEETTSLLDRLLSPFRTRTVRSLPWYCSKPYATVHNVYRSACNFVMEQILEILSFICFFDVFVKFFTGEIDPVTHELKPKPFVKRWLFPGLLLQLLVNPSIEKFSELFFRVADWVGVIGPVRVLRWCIAVVVPVVYGLRNLAIEALRKADSVDEFHLATYAMMLWEYSW